MSTTSKSPRMVLLVAYATGKEALAEYTHPCSPKKFTQPQLFACLVLKTFLRTDYRGLAKFLDDLPDLRGRIDLKRTAGGTLRTTGGSLCATAFEQC